MAITDVDNSGLSADSELKLVRSIGGFAATWRSVCIHQMNRPVTWQIPLNRPCAAAMRPVVKLL